jgi:flagellar hook-associated protein 1 FlgK
MPTAYLALDIARRAMMTSQTNLQIISHNIANAGRPGYSRQRAELRPAPPLAYPSMTKGAYKQQLGTGVEVAAINRIRDSFLDHIIRNQIGDQGSYSTLDQIYDNLEVLFDEPSDTGLGNSITEYFATWNDLANDPELASTRANLREKAIILTGYFHDYDARLKELREDTNAQIELKVNEVNNLLYQIADLNQQIMSVEGLGDHANDLKDQRGLLVEQLSEIIKVNTIDQVDASLTVMIGAIRVVERDSVTPIETRIDQGNFLSITVLNNIKPPLTGGELYGLFIARDELIPEFQDKLDTLASGIINRINYQHKQGWGLDGQKGRAFFDDLRTARLIGDNFLPAGTTGDTTLFELGIIEGFFEVQGARINLTYEEVSPDNSLTLNELFERINAAQHTVRASLWSDAAGNTAVTFDLYNPAAQDDGIDIIVGSSNFLTFTGINTATIQYTGANKLYGNAAERIDLTDMIQSDLDAIAAALDSGDDIFPGVGDNSNALAISAIENFGTAIARTTIEDYFNGMVSSLGSQSQAQKRLVTNQELLITQLTNQRESISGVNMDEEATKIIQFERMYQGAARVVTVVDELLDTLINRMGV